MKTTEIMINDLFYVEDGEGKHIVRITSIDSPVESVRGICLDNGEDTGWFSVDFLIPIGVKEEILKVNEYKVEDEFEHCDYGIGDCYIYNCNNGYIEIYFRDSFDTMTSAGTETSEPSVISVLITSEKGSYETTRIGNPFYTHELQHALRLCGLDDIANNFRIN